MVETIASVTAALCAASTLSQAKALHVPAEPPTSLKTPDHLRVQTERRRAARNATNAASTVEALRPMLERMKADSAVSDSKKLLDQAEQQMKSGKTEQAMLSLDGVSLRLDEVRVTAGKGPYLDLLQELERREAGLRERLGAPSLPVLSPFPKADEKAGGKPATDEPVKPPKRDELPVG